MERIFNTGHEPDGTFGISTRGALRKASTRITCSLVICSFLLAAFLVSGCTKQNGTNGSNDTNVSPPMETNLVGTWVSEVIKNDTDTSHYYIVTLTFNADGMVSMHYDRVVDGDISEGPQMQWAYGMNSNRKTLILKDDSSGKISEEDYLIFSRGSFTLEPCGKKNPFSHSLVYYKKGTAKAVQNLKSLANFKASYQKSLLSSVVGTWVSPVYQYAGLSIMTVTFYNDGTVSWGVGDSETSDTSYTWSFGSSQDQKTLQLTEYAGIQQYYITFSDKNFVLRHFGSGANSFFLLPDGQYNNLHSRSCMTC